MKAIYPIYFTIGNMIYKKFYFLYKPLYFFYKRLSDGKKIKSLKEVVKPGMRVLDIGANIGFYTILLSELVGDRGLVYAFEPDENNFSHLKRNTVSLKNVALNNVAVSDKSGKLKLYLSDDLNVDHNTYDSGENRKSVEVDALALDDYFSHGETIDFVKIDIQGFDFYALNGAKNLISRSGRMSILSEYWPYGLNKAGVKPRDYIDLLKELNFAIDLSDDDIRRSEVQIDDNNFSLDIFAYRNQ